MSEIHNFSSDSEGSPFFNLLNITALLTLLSALLYTAGWAFAYHYFDHFHVGLLTVEIPFEYYFIYSFWVLKDNLILITAVYLFLFLFFYLINLLKLRGGRKGILHPLLTILIPIIIFLLFFGSYKLGKNSGDNAFYKQQGRDYPAYPRVRVWIKAYHQKDRRLEGDLKKGCYRLLLQNKNNLFLFFSLKENTIAQLPLLVIPSDQVETVKILPHYKSCGGEV